MSTAPIPQPRPRASGAGGAGDAGGDAAAGQTHPLGHRVQHLAYRAGLALVQLAQHERAASLGEIAGRLAWLVLRGRRRRALDNVAKALVDLPPKRRARVARRSFETFGRFAFEQVSATRFAPAEIEERFEVAGAEHLAAATSSGRGVLVLTGHFGPFDLAAYPLRRRLEDLHLVYRPASNPLVDREFRAVRERTGAVLVPRQRVAQRLFLALRAGKSVAAAIDQRVNPLAGILVEFLGRPAWATSVPALLQLRTGAEVLPIFAYPASRGRYRLEVDPPVSATGLGDDPEAELTRRYFEPLERRIRRDPELWMWLHERWQLVFRHRDPRIRERLARESGLAELPEQPKVAPPARDDRATRTVLEPERLESCRNVVLAGSTEAVRRAARDLVAAALADGFAARAEHATELAARLRRAQAAHRLSAELRQLDRRALIWLEGLEQLDDDQARGLVARQLERRRGRGSMLLDANVPTGTGDPLSAALCQARDGAFRLPV